MYGVEELRPEYLFSAWCECFVQLPGKLCRDGRGGNPAQLGRELWLQLCSRLLTDLHSIYCSAQQGLQNVEQTFYHGFAFILSCYLEETGGEAGSHALEEFAVHLLNNAFERIAIQCQYILPVVAKVNSIYPPSCLSTNVSVNADKEEGHYSIIIILEKGSRFLFLAANWFSHCFNPNQHDGGCMSSLIL